VLGGKGNTTKPDTALFERLLETIRKNAWCRLLHGKSKEPEEICMKRKNKRRIRRGKRRLQSEVVS
jgi:hypothetical protein